MYLDARTERCFRKGKATLAIDMRNTGQDEPAAQDLHCQNQRDEIASTRQSLAMRKRGNYACLSDAWTVWCLSCIPLMN